MKKYNIKFGEIIDGMPKNIQDLYYCDNKGNKKVKDLKDFITCYDDNLCPCMLKLYNIESKILSFDYKEYNQKDDENELELDKINKDSIIAIMQTKKKCNESTCLRNNNFFSLPKYELIRKLNIQTSQINNLEKTNEWNLSKEKIENFYDVIIDINSILNLKEGWKVEMTERGAKKYEDFKDEELIRIGVVGNVNKGKTFILSKLSKIILPSGTSISTKGISVKYPELKDNNKRKYILLDSAGLETPIKKDDISKLRVSLEDNKDNELENNSENNDDSNKNSELKKIKIKDQKFKEKIRDILITESFLQNFIISNSNILLLIVDLLNTSEQKLINKIKHDIKKANKKEIKKLFIIHNLKTYRTKEQVEKYLNEVLFNSGTFDLQRHEDITADTKTIEGEHFTETEEKDIKVYHLIFAADDSEAGNYYNKYTINFIEKQYSDVYTKTKFDIIEEVKKQFSISSKRYLNKKIELSDFNSNEEIKQEKLILLKDKNQEVSLKKCFTDELGYQQFKGSGFEPPYTLFKKDNILDLRIEVPGNAKPTLSNPTCIGEYTYIQVKGKKNPDKELKDPDNDSICNTREFGDFNLQIELRTDKYKIKKVLNENKIKNGILFIKYELENEVSEEQLTSVELDEEI